MTRPPGERSSSPASSRATTRGDDSRVGHGFEPTIKDVPVPSSALASAGSDGQLVLWDPRAGVEYGFWYFDRDASGGLVAINGYRYHTTSGYLGRFADGLAGRGAGTPYLAGLVRSWEIASGRIDHALAFTYNQPSRAFVYPASKSNGFGGPAELAVGTRLRLDPTRTEADFGAWGLTAPAKIIARALQRYGMYVVGSSGSSKVYLEDRLTAGCNSSITRNLTRAIPMSAFRLVAGPSGETPGLSPASPLLAPTGQPDGRTDARAARAKARRIMDQIARRLRAYASAHAGPASRDHRPRGGRLEQRAAREGHRPGPQTPDAADCGRRAIAGAPDHQAAPASDEGRHAAAALAKKRRHPAFAEGGRGPICDEAEPFHPSSLLTSGHPLRLVVARSV